MTVRSVSYNPAFLTDQQLVDQFAVREHELARLLQSIRENTDAINQHLLVIAPPGAGKTTLVRRVVAEVRRDADLKGSWLPVLFGEEEYLVSTAGEFWLEAVLHLADATGDESWRRVHDVLLDESDEMRLADKALARLRDAATARGARILLVAENLHQLLGELHPDDAWAIRKVLQNEPWLMLLGTAICGFPAIERPTAPLYELFERVELAPLDDPDCDRLWAGVTGQPLGPSRIKPIRILTGGSVRLLRMMAHFAIGRSFRELLDGLLEFLDGHTNYFKHNIEDLDATTERKAFIALADLWEPSTARDVARRGRLQVNETSTYLGRLVDKGRVAVVGKRGRAKLYQVAERLYNIYHLMRRRGSPRARVQALVEFMVGFYDDRELTSVLADLVAEALALPSGGRLEHFAALEGVLDARKQTDSYAVLLRALTPSFVAADDAPDTIRDLGRTPESLAALLAGPDGAAWVLPALRAFALATGADKAAWTPALELAVEVADARGTRGLANLLLARSLADPRQRLTALERHPFDDAIYLRELGYLRRETEDWSGAAEAFRRALELDPTAMATRGDLLRVLVQAQDWAAISALADEVEPSSPLGLLANVCAAIGETLSGKPDAATLRIQRALQPDPADPDVRGMAANVLLLLGNPEAADEAFLVAPGDAPPSDHVWFLFLDLSVGMRRLPQSIELARRGVEVYPQSALLRLSLARALALVGDPEALASLAALTRLEPRDLPGDALQQCLIDLAAGGFAAELADLLPSTWIAAQVEPILVALQILLGNPPDAVPRELLDVAEDVVARIRQREPEIARP